MAEFSASAVIGMLALVESTVVMLYVRLGSKKADEEDVDDLEETASVAVKRSRENAREIAHLERQIDARADGGPEHEPDHE